MSKLKKRKRRSEKEKKEYCHCGRPHEGIVGKSNFKHRGIGPWDTSQKKKTNAIGTGSCGTN